MSHSISRRTLIGRAAAGATIATLAGSPAILAQDDRPTVAIGSKDFTESIVLGEIVAHLLEENGFDVERQLNLGGTLLTHEALVNGDIDTYVEYTGTGLIAIMGQELPERTTPPAVDESGASATPTSGGIADTVYDIVATEYPAEYGVEWLEPWGFNNTNAIAMRREHAEELGITSISDLVNHADQLSIGAPQEALAREDGIPGLEATYGFEFDDVVGMDTGLMYSAAENGDVDLINAHSTDPRVASMDLVLLDDDLSYYPPYHAAPVVRQELLDQAPEVREILNSVAGTIDDSRMTELNYQADVEGKEPSDVARDFLTEQGLISGDD